MGGDAPKPSGVIPRSGPQAQNSTAILLYATFLMRLWPMAFIFLVKHIGELV
jgi:hypothetical protein